MFFSCPSRLLDKIDIAVVGDDFLKISFECECNSLFGILDSKKHRRFPAHLRPILALSYPLFRWSSRWYVAIQLLCAIAFKLFLNTLSVQLVHPYNSMDTTVALKNAFYFIG